MQGEYADEPHTYGERDYTFGQVILTLRTAMHLTQVELAQFLHVSRHANNLAQWEQGEFLLGHDAGAEQPMGYCRAVK